MLVWMEQRGRGLDAHNRGSRGWKPFVFLLKKDPAWGGREEQNREGIRHTNYYGQKL